MLKLKTFYLALMHVSMVSIQSEGKQLALSIRGNAQPKIVSDPDDVAAILEALDTEANRSKIRVMQQDVEDAAEHFAQQMETLNIEVAGAETDAKNEIEGYKLGVTTAQKEMEALKAQIQQAKDTLESMTYKILSRPDDVKETENIDDAKESEMSDEPNAEPKPKTRKAKK